MTHHESMPNVTARRTSAKTYSVRGASGAELRIGPPGVDGVFTPVELLQAAMAGCAGLSAETQLTQSLGADFQATASVKVAYDHEENRVTELVTTVAVDMAGAEADARNRTISRAERFIDSLCTVKRSLNHGIGTVTGVENMHR